jgi:tripartite-type tricarboxylate transporter receptor subunit TctC
LLFAVGTSERQLLRALVVVRKIILMKNLVGCFVLLAFWTSAASAQDRWPTRSVTIVVASAAGGATDLFGRVIAQSLSETLKQTFVVENRGGGGGNIGAATVAKAPADGYTILVAGTQSLVTNPSLQKNLPYNAERDLAPVARGVISPMVIVAHPSLPARTLSDLVGLGKQSPGTIPYGSAGFGSTTYLGVRILEEMTLARFLHVPFKGVAQAFQTLASGDIKFIYSDVGTALPTIQSGALRALAVTQAVGQLPDTPTFASAGYPGAEVIGTFSVAVPAGTPTAIIQRLSAAINEAMRTPEVSARLQGQALLPVFDTPQEYATTLRTERSKWSEFFQRNKISLD